MRIVFFGTPEFAVPSLRHFLSTKEFQIRAVFTQPDRPRGRGADLAAPPVKQAALAAGVAVHQPEKIRAPEAEHLLRELAPEAIVIIGYGQIIPARLLDIPRHGWINLHASLLPKYRGAAPVQWAIARGETQTGLTTMRIDAGMDTGPMLLQEAVAIEAAETAPELAAKLALRGAPLLAETLRRLELSSLEAKPQNEREASYAPILKKEDGRIRWTLAAPEIFNRMRGFTPWPGSFTTFRGVTCHVTGQPATGITNAPAVPGEIFVRERDLFAACGETTALRLLTVKVEGRKQVTAAEFANGARLQRGERFGED